MFHGRIKIGQGLGFHALGGIHEKEHSLAGRKSPRHLVGKVHMAGRVDEVQGVGFPVGGRVGERHRVALDRDAPFPLQIQGIQDLIAKFPLIDEPGRLDESVGQGRFAVIDVRDDTEISNVFHARSSCAV